MIKVNTNCGRSAGKVEYISLDRRFEDERSFVGQHDPRINTRKRLRKPRRARRSYVRVWFASLTAFEWFQLFGLALLGLLLVSYLLYK